MTGESLTYGTLPVIPLLYSTVSTIDVLRAWAPNSLYHTLHCTIPMKRNTAPYHGGGRIVYCANTEKSIHHTAPYRTISYRITPCRAVPYRAVLLIRWIPFTVLFIWFLKTVIENICALILYSHTHSYLSHDDFTWVLIRPRETRLSSCCIFLPGGSDESVSTTFSSSTIRSNWSSASRSLASGK